jgi:two-component system, LytTR family, sensor histidine kinase AlgZ
LARIYLDVEQVRFGSRLQVEFKIDDNCRHCLSPPLLLQPLIENAVKHGVATLDEGGWIRLESQVRNGRLEVRVANNYDPQAPTPRRRGLGLRNVRSRLETRFGPLAAMKTTVKENIFLVEIAMPCESGEQL